MRFPLAAAALLAGLCQNEPTEVKRVEVVQAPPSPYDTDCGHVFTAPYDEMGERGEKNECEARDFEQNCAPDLDGCWNAEETCKDACGKPTCLDCQAKCTAVCTDCKARGNKDCATTREACRQSCLKARDTCRDTTCPAEAKACTEKAEARRAALCPNCEALKTCLADRLYGKDAQGKEWSVLEQQANAACGKLTPNKECLKLCMPDP